MPFSKSTIVFIVLFCYLFCSCDVEKRKAAENEPLANISSINNDSLILQNSLEKAKKEINYEALQINPFFYFKSFHLQDSTLNAISITTSAKDKFEIELYQLENQVWILLDKVDTLKAELLQFDLNIEDYNFDQTKDFYIQTSASNGLVQSFGYLIICKNKKLIPQKYGLEYPNLTPQAKLKTVLSKNVIYCKDGPLYVTFCEKTLSWKNDSLVLIKEDCPCESDS
jgi:hypothetical protein